MKRIKIDSRRGFILYGIPIFKDPFFFYFRGGGGFIHRLFPTSGKVLSSFKVFRIYFIRGKKSRFNDNIFLHYLKSRQSFRRFLKNQPKGNTIKPLVILRFFLTFILFFCLLAFIFFKVLFQIWAEAYQTFLIWGNN